MVPLTSPIYCEILARFTTYQVEIVSVSVIVMVPFLLHGSAYGNIREKNADISFDRSTNRNPTFLPLLPC